MSEDIKTTITGKTLTCLQQKNVMKNDEYVLGKLQQDKLNTESFATVADYLADYYENGFLGALYDLQGQSILLILPMNQEEAVRAIQIDSKISKGLYQRMGKMLKRARNAKRFLVKRKNRRQKSGGKVHRLVL